LRNLKKEKLNKKEDLLDFGIGEPLDKPSDSTLLSLIEHSTKDESNYYSDNGTVYFNQEIIKYMKNVINLQFINKLILEKILNCSTIR
jgi:aspartate/methionine/tyrosine aminotransferase